MFLIIKLVKFLNLVRKHYQLVGTGYYPHKHDMLVVFPNFFFQCIPTLRYMIPPGIVILVYCFLRIPTQQLGCWYGIDFWKVLGIFPVKNIVSFNFYLIILSSA